jgi:ABC-type amino acid transport substrate-binding protein
MKKQLLMFALVISAFSNEKPFIVNYSDIVQPCAMVDSSHKPYGFDIDLFNKISERVGLTNYQYRQVNFKDIFINVKSGSADLGIGGITITSKREKSLDFTHPYLEADIKALVKADKESSLHAIWFAISQDGVLRLIVIILAFALIWGSIFWVIERKMPENKGKFFLWLILDYCLFVLVTLSTVGYGDRTAKTAVGKILVGMMIVTGLSLFAYYLGMITNNIQFDRTTSEVTCLKDLRDKPIATVEDCYAADVIQDENIGSKVIKVKGLPEALKLLALDKVKVVIFDAPPLLQYASKNKGYMVAPFSIRTQNYGFALPVGSPWRSKINRAILELQESGEYQRIYDKWF